MSITEQYTNEDIIRHSMTVPVPIDRAFIIFTEDMGKMARIIVLSWVHPKADRISLTDMPKSL